MADTRRFRTAGHIVLIAAGVVAVILVLHIIFVLLDANTGNSIVSTDASWASTIAQWFLNLFTPSNYKLSVFLNYGLATIVWLAAGRLVASVVNRL